MNYYDRMRLKHCLLIPLLLTLAVTAQAQTTPSPEPGGKVSALDSGLFYQLLLGELNARSGEPAAAFSLMLDAARKTNDPNLFRRAVQIALQARSGESALLAARAWLQAVPASREANRYVLQVLLGLNRIADTLEPLKRDIALTPVQEQRDVIWSIPGIFERASDRALAASTVKKALASFFQDRVMSPTAWAVVGRMALSAGDKPAALSAAANGLGQDPRSEHPALLALSLMSPELPAAEDLVGKHLPHARPEFRMAYVKALLNAKREADAKAQLESIRIQSPDYPDTWLINGALALQDGQFDDAQRQLQRYLDLTEATTPNEPRPEFVRGRTQAFLSLAQIAQQRKDFKAADAWLQRVDTPDELLRAQIRRAALLAQQGQLEAGLTLIRNHAARSAEEAQQKSAAEVQLLKDDKQFARARNLLQSSLLQTPDDPDLIYDLAMVHEKLGELGDMERLLRGLIASKPDDPHAYNALGYSFAEHGMRLPEAKALISKALELSPNDPFIIDSLGWVEFRSGNLNVALELLQGAFKAKPDAEIAAHLGEVLWALKRQPEALQVWREGVKLNPTNETLVNTLKRLQVTL
ncbi:tetratricopeptide repeat protein [Rhodoferax sp.]|uniref:tetratricopeptide repeat protein n=1 Tax=Rhodoferax sp. TaxID=50421 RepID=UPI0026024EB7|nr:tetratricopeptide repeat protein [Rhodoferax sp.]